MNVEIHQTGHLGIWNSIYFNKKYHLNMIPNTVEIFENEGTNMKVKTRFKYLIIY